MFVLCGSDSNLLLSSGKATGGRRAPSTQGRKVISPVTMWLQQTPYRLKSKNSHNCLSKHSIFASLCHPTTFISTSLFFFLVPSCYFPVPHPTESLNNEAMYCHRSRWRSLFCSSCVTETLCCFYTVVA